MRRVVFGVPPQRPCPRAAPRPLTTPKHSTPRAQSRPRARHAPGAAKALPLPPGFEIQLVACEAGIKKAINIAFDRRGRLW